MRLRGGAALRACMERPVQGDADAALQAFLSCSAAAFLREWLPDGTHRRLMERLTRRLDGVAGLHVPEDETAALQLAQHARELAAVLGPTAWTERIAAATAALLPARDPRDGGEVALLPARVAAGEDGGDLLLRLHARRRLWALTHAAAEEEPARPVPDWALTLARRAAASADGHAVQVAEAALAELAYGG